MAIFPQHPKRDQNLKLTPLNETTSTPTFLYSSPPPPHLPPGAVRQLHASNQIYKMTKSYRVIADELFITHQNILLRGSRIALPVKLRERAIMLAHEDHAGMTR